MNYRVHVRSGIIHNLSSCCTQCSRIKVNNYHDVYTLAEAVQFAKSCGNVGQKCQHCSWKQVATELRCDKGI